MHSRSSIQSHRRTMNHGLLFCLLAMSLTASARAQLARPIDPNRQADVNGKIISPGNLNLRNIAQPTVNFSRSPRSDERQSFSQIELKNVDLQQLQLSGYSTQIVPQQNFAAKRAAIAEKTRDEKQFPVTKAPIKDRQIAPLTPTGEEELKKQLNEPR